MSDEKQPEMIERVALALMGHLRADEQDDFRLAARAAIEAMREPTEEMVAAAGSGAALEADWQAMIDGALK